MNSITILTALLNIPPYPRSLPRPRPTHNRCPHQGLPDRHTCLLPPRNLFPWPYPLLRRRAGRLEQSFEDWTGMVLHGRAGQLNTAGIRLDVRRNLAELQHAEIDGHRQHDLRNL